ncbi:AraC family transcriptional regulator [Aquabacterium sp. A7-Y]|uniref:AraC family transcriptional regulator n=1 Tax=Aquabacterium sp. A7-Y TaxID=1349605 RepID=UPI00223E6D7C|nr:AraC family transcriptional regulator [Aquabacterium sp. A7-Y]MCW7540572.1 AraC family transcriptional regulator [Aquabacterium sp. A7-Y]
MPPASSSSSTLHRASVSVAYPALLLAIVAERGVDPAAVLQAAGVPSESLARPGGRISPIAYAAMVLQAARLTGDQGLGMELGLRLGPSSHGFLGYAMLTSASLGEAIALGMRFGAVRQHHLAVSLHRQGEQAALELHEQRPLGEAREFFLEAMGVGSACALVQLTGMPQAEMALDFDHAEPAHYAAYRHRLPPARFASRAVRLVFPAHYLALPLPMANRDACLQAVVQCERELAEAELEGRAAESMAAQVRRELELALERRPGLAELAERLHTSERTLKRRLQGEGSSFRVLLDDVRRREALRLLEQTTLEVGDIAAKLGYEDPANFTRAFVRWTASPPSRWRSRCKDSGG